MSAKSWTLCLHNWPSWKHHVSAYPTTTGMSCQRIFSQKVNIFGGKVPEVPILLSRNDLHWTNSWNNGFGASEMNPRPPTSSIVTDLRAHIFTTTSIFYISPIGLTGFVPDPEKFRTRHKFASDTQGHLSSFPTQLRLDTASAGFRFKLALKWT